MKYEKPRMELMEMEEDVITTSTSLDPGGNSGSDMGDWGEFGF